MSTPFARSRRPGGFSLIEIIVAIAIFGILVALAAPSLTGWINRSRLDAAAGQLSADLANARMLAVRSGQGATVTLLAGGTSYRVVNPGGGTKTVDFERDYPRVQLSWAGGTSTPLELQFNSRGLLRNPNHAQVITIQQDGRTANLRLLATGRAFVENY